ncbi:DUF1697 domain-containing protein [uncultured Winogradskyella sp.]|uniref:DUF1697 domain-containing protein n=1 Tax=uncultured Winogradskyella sp. TaxID=395353 RepID=UPI0030D725D1|tara:strand:- start:158 stop:697 length:540 start_codon:yes stop_codon:yes gene_type:complete
MKTYIALLRGINVGGHKKIPMAELRELLTKSGLENVKTYIQSGNVIFKSNISYKQLLEDLIHNAIKDKFGFTVPVLVRTRDDLEAIFDDCPFSEEKKVNSYFTMLSEIPNKDLVDEASEKTYPNEEYVILKDCIYFFCSIGYGNAKFNLSFFERKLKINATSRNYKTMVKLLSLSQIND